MSNLRRIPLRVSTVMLLCLVLAACSPAPVAPLQPRQATATPLETHPSPTPAGRVLPVDAATVRRFEAIQSDRLIYVISSLVNLKTRSVYSALARDPSWGIDAARRFIQNQFTALRDRYPEAALDVWTQPVQVAIKGAHPSTSNVVAVLPGTDVDAGVVVVGAHYDTLLNVDANNAELAAPGANLNGSGIAAVLEIAQIMAAEPHRATIVFIAFTAMETGRQGSRAFVQDYLAAQNPPIVPRAVLILDGIGGNLSPTGTPGPSSLRIFSANANNSPARQLARQLQLAASAYLDAPTFLVQSNEERFGHTSDHQSFVAADMPAVHLVETVENPGRQRNGRDTLDGVQPSYLMAVIQGVLAGLGVLVDGPNPPQGFAMRAGDPPALTWQAAPDASGYIVVLRQDASPTFDQVFVTGKQAEFSWSGLSRFDVAAVASVDTQGRMGPLSSEIELKSLNR